MQDMAISLIDKRRLMKFLQFCGASTSEEESGVHPLLYFALAALSAWLLRSLHAHFPLSPPPPARFLHPLPLFCMSHTGLLLSNSRACSLTLMRCLGCSRGCTVVWGCAEHAVQAQGRLATVHSARHHRASANGFRKLWGAASCFCVSTQFRRFVLPRQYRCGKEAGQCLLCLTPCFLPAAVLARSCRPGWPRHGGS